VPALHGEGAAVCTMPPLQHNLTPDDVPDYMVCAITSQVFRDPVVCQDGNTYEREAVERWLETHNTSPMHGAILPNNSLVPNLALRHQIEHTALTNSRSGVAVDTPTGPSGSTTRHGNPKRCAVLDFDNTVSTKQVGVFDLSAQVADRCFGGALRVQQIKRLLEELLARNVAIVVLTRNSAHTVRKALSAVGLVVSEIIGNEKFEMDVPKSVIIQQAVMEPHGFGAQDLVFVDDELGNIRDVGDGVGCACIHVDNTGMKVRGMTQAHCEQIQMLCLET